VDELVNQLREIDINNANNPTSTSTSGVGKNQKKDRDTIQVRL